MGTRWESGKDRRKEMRGLRRCRVARLERLTACERGLMTLIKNHPVFHLPSLSPRSSVCLCPSCHFHRDTELLPKHRASAEVSVCCTWEFLFILHLPASSFNLACLRLAHESLIRSKKRQHKETRRHISPTNQENELMFVGLQHRRLYRRFHMCMNLCARSCTGMCVT